MPRHLKQVAAFPYPKRRFYECPGLQPHIVLISYL
jgi:hypothetical protein